ncbi:ornithine cyclodeaminase family protein [Acidocella sp. KAb 2-4]|uniref:ornithine cyclodeaminase family protein n=1 Tax=Acidocella sp. KAb 2-4 TaxID=2885158 RepID=UPI001D06A208|nr:NAD(P)-binding domain-containing protein [Acidocella sp. KAb 2-4]MCB5945512.1 NAD(P)-binding domain-containing protein [Acidocella sp. KAb 2-4]
MSTSGNVAKVKTKFIGDADVEALADWASTVAALRAAYAGEIKPDMVPPRTMARGAGFWLRALSAISPSGAYMGCKLIAASPKEKRASYLISLFDQTTMDLAALVDGNRITGLRTAGTAAVAVDLLAPAKALKVAVLGSGFEARGLFEALLATRDVAEALVFSPTTANREKFAQGFRDTHKLAVSAVASAEAAVTGADVVLAAARSYDESPVLQGKWLAPGAVVVSVGSTLPEQREVDVETLARAALIVADMPEEVAHETGDAMAAHKAGCDVAAKMVPLSDIASGKAARPAPGEAIVVYKSVGSALQDIVIAEMILNRAEQAQSFVELNESVHTIIK